MPPSLPATLPTGACPNFTTFWDLITERKIWPFTPDGDVFRKAPTQRAHG
jgi:hypothetical protein